MGRKSTKENKNVYQIRREELGLSREKAAALLGTVSEDRIYDIEHKGNVHPDEVLIMAKGYKDPALCSYYCANQCPIGQEHFFEVNIKDLPTIVLETVASLNAIDKHKNRFIEIAADGIIDEPEIEDFQAIQEALKMISISVESLRLWAEQMELERRDSHTSN